jgi:hypothetical protein
MYAGFSYSMSIGLERVSLKDLPETFFADPDDICNYIKTFSHSEES